MRNELRHPDNTISSKSLPSQRKPSFREVLEEVYGCPISEEEAADAKFALIEFFKILDAMDREQRAKKQKRIQE